MKGSSTRRTRWGNGRGSKAEGAGQGRPEESNRLFANAAAEVVESTRRTGQGGRRRRNSGEGAGLVRLDEQAGDEQQPAACSPRRFYLGATLSFSIL
jgi:hypothetical protein